MEWKICWADEECNSIEIRAFEGDNQVLETIFLEAPNYAKLYYALMDWFGDSKRSSLTVHPKKSELPSPIVLRFSKAERYDG